MTEREKAEFERKKAEAERQLNEMYYGSSNSKGKNGLKMPPFLSHGGNAGQKSSSTTKDTDKRPDEPPKRNEPMQKKPAKSTKGFDLLGMLNFKGMEMDNDRLLILALFLLLSGEESDELLSLALLYIML